MSEAPSTRQVFVSYAPFDERHDGRLAALCERLTDEVRLRTGKDCLFWRDRELLEVGADWKETMDRALKESKVLVAFVTPSYLQSQYCRTELEHFLKIHSESDAEPRVIMINYVGDMERAGHLTGEGLGGRPLLDWRELRFEPFTSPVMQREMSRAADLIGEALEASELTTGP